MDRCMEEISAAVLDAGEPLSYRTLGMRSYASPSVSSAALAQFAAENDGVKVLNLLVQRAAISNDPRARVLRLTAEESKDKDAVACQQVYAVYAADKDAKGVVTACWAQERQTRNEVLAKVEKHQPLPAGAKALYSSEVKCTEATARVDFGEDQGEDTISAFDSINSSKKSTSSGASFFKSSKSNTSSKTGFKSSSASNGKSTAPSNEGKVSAATMNNVLTIDSDDDEDDETDAPVFVKKASSNGRGKRVISDDDDEEEEAPKKAASTPAKSRNVKRKLNASPAETKRAKKQVESEEDKDSDDAGSASPEAPPVIATKRQVLVTKTRINEQGYMVTEKTYEEVELTPEEIEKEKKSAQKKLEEKRKKAAAEKAAKAKKEAKKHSGPPKQRDLRSFFSVK